MSSEVFDNSDDGLDAVVVRQRPRDTSTDNHALVALQEGTSGLGHALKVKSENSEAPAAVIQGAGPLLQFRRDDGTIVGEIGNDGGFGDISLDTVTASERLTVAGFVLPQHYPGRRPPYRQPTSIITIFASGHGWTTSGAIGSSDLNDTTDFVKGTQAARVTSDGAATAGGMNLQRLTNSLPDLTGKAIRVVAKIDDVSKLAGFNLLVGTNTSFSNSFKWQLLATTSTSKVFKSGEWTTLTFGWADVHSGSGTFSLDTHGTPSATTGFNQIRFQIIDNGSPVTAHVQSVEVIDNLSATFPNGVISITFDDSWDTQWTLARPKMDALGYRGTMMTIAERVGQSGRVTMSQLRHLQDESGWEVAGHAYTTAIHDARLTSGTKQQIDDELRNLRSWLVSNGFNGDSYAYPGGNFENTTDGFPIEDLVRRYFASGRTVLTGYGAATNTLKEQYPPPRPYRMLAQSAISGASSGMDLPANLVGDGGTLDRIKRQGAWGQLTFHVLTTGSEGGDTGVITQTDFNTIMDAIASYGIPVLPTAEVMRHFG